MLKINFSTKITKIKLNFFWNVVPKRGLISIKFFHQSWRTDFTDLSCPSCLYFSWNTAGMIMNDMIINVKKIAFTLNFDKKYTESMCFRVKIFDKKKVSRCFVNRNISLSWRLFRLGNLSQQWFIVFKTQTYCFKNNIKK